MKRSDVKLVAGLRRNARLSLTNLARKTCLPLSTLHERLRSHARSGVMRPILLLDFARLGFSASAFVKLAVDNKDKDAIFSFLRVHPNVNALFRINNGWHVLAEVVFHDMSALEDFVEQVEAKFTVKQKDVCYVLGEVARENFLGDAKSAEELLKVGDERE
ncbi:Lrp/AsnC family transcriptional regulator [Candidatus Woesearchaeota archaeon]|nr:Lrp/AsnC family transcriptional regulator [Candidatus Woesearchaeota archaeon]